MFALVVKSVKPTQERHLHKSLVLVHNESFGFFLVCLIVVSVD